MIDILYVNYNSSDVLENSINSLYRNKGEELFNIHVWDNNSIDNIKRIKKRYPDVNLYLSKKNLGFAKGINGLLKFTRSAYIVILNPDTLIANNFVCKSTAYLDANLQVGILGPKILNIDGTIQGSARSFPNPMTSLFGRSSPLTKLFPNNSITAKNILTNKNEIKQPTEVDWVSGACMVVRREAILSVGGFDERFFLYWEDADLCRRIKEKGWRVMYYPSCQIVHCVGESSNTRPVFANYQFHKSCYRLYDKYVECPYSILTPFAAVALMLRFIVAILFNKTNRIFLKLKRKKRNGQTSSEIKKTITKTEMVSRKKKVLNIITRLIVGGAQETVIDTTNLLDENKWKTCIYTGNQTGSEGSLFKNVNQKKTPLFIDSCLVREINPPRDFIAFIKLFQFIKRRKFDVVHTHSSKAGIIGRWAAYIANTPVIIHTVHGWGFHEHQKTIIRLLFIILEKVSLSITDKLIAVTREDIEKGIAVGIGELKNYEMIRSGINLQHFSNPTVGKDKIRSDLNIPPSSTVVGTVTRLSEQKAPMVFIEAAAEVLKKNRDVMFVIVGDGPLRDELLKRIKSLNIDSYFRFTGIRSDVNNLLNSFDVFALSSLWEGLPRVIPQAMAAGIPVVVSAVDGNKEIVVDYKNGRLVKPGRSDFLAEAILELLERPALAERLKHEAMATIAEYDERKMVDRIQRLYCTKMSFYPN